MESGWIVLARGPVTIVLVPLSCKTSLDSYNVCSKIRIYFVKLEFIFIVFREYVYIYMHTYIGFFGSGAYAIENDTVNALGFPF
jgi:hypothetical protein